MVAVTSVLEIKNSTSKKRFSEQWASLVEPQELVLFHGINDSQYLRGHECPEGHLRCGACGIPATGFWLPEVETEANCTKFMRVSADIYFASDLTCGKSRRRQPRFCPDLLCRYPHFSGPIDYPIGKVDRLPGVRSMLVCKVATGHHYDLRHDAPDLQGPPEATTRCTARPVVVGRSPTTNTRSITASQWWPTGCVIEFNYGPPLRAEARYRQSPRATRGDH